MPAKGARYRIYLLLLMIAPQALPAYIIGQVCKVGSWRLYPILAKLDGEGSIESEFIGLDYPRKRMYRAKQRER